MPGAVLIYLRDNTVSGGACTLGFNARKNEQSGEYLVTASHCTTVRDSATGNVVKQPTLDTQDTSRYRIAIESYDPAPATAGCGYSNAVCRWSDAALAEYDLSGDSEFGYLARVDAYEESLEISTTNPRWEIDSYGGTFYVGRTIDKIGVATGWTAGGVDDTCHDFVYHSTATTNHWLLCQVVAHGLADDGDSGGPAFTPDFTAGTVQVNGIVWAKWTLNFSGFVFSPPDGLAKDGFDISPFASN